MLKHSALSFIIGFLILFIIYHFPEFFPAFWITATFKIGFLIVAYFLAKAQGWKGLGGYGLSLKSNWGSHLVIGLLLGLTFFALSFCLSVLMGYEKIEAVTAFSSVAGQLPTILLMTAIPSVAEDILTRGYLYAHLMKYLKPLPWVLLSSTIYVLNHIWRLGDGAAVLSYLFLLGLVLAYAVLIARSLWLAFGIHWGANIAFESIRALFETSSTTDSNAGNWILAGCWALLLVVMLTKKLYPNNRNGRLATDN